MKKLLLLHLFISFASFSRAQFFPGNFYHNLQGTSTYPCIVDSSFYAIRYGGVERFSSASHSVEYLWNRFYNAQAIAPAPDSSMVLLKGGRVYRYLPATDSLFNISDSLIYSVADVASSGSIIWAALAFDEIARYDNMGWHIISLSSNTSFTRILPVNDTSAYLADNLHIWLYTSSGLSAPLYTFGTSEIMTEWVSDTAGNAWILSNGNIRRISPGGNTTVFNQLNQPLTSGDLFSHITVTNRSSIFASTQLGYIYAFRGGSWLSFNLRLHTSAQSIAADPTNHNIYIQGNNDSIYILNDSTNLYPVYPCYNMPYQNIQAISTDFIATDQGIFSYASSQSFQLPSLEPTYFRDTSVAQYANDVTCFVVGSQTTDQGYGTHHGVFNLATPINNASLPDSNINYIFSAMGSYYIGTNKGLCVYNQVIYTTYDTSNSGLPSDSVTFVTSYLSPYTNAQELWVGTRAGVALYSNGVWTKYDTSLVHISNFRVTGILPCPMYYGNPDTSVWITTLGNGLVKLKRDGQYTLLNTSNGGFRDDSLYYITQYDGCLYASTVMIGTNTKGIAYYEWPIDTFNYSNLGYDFGESIAYQKSDLYVNSFVHGNYFNGELIQVTDEGFNILGGCVGEGISDMKKASRLTWYQTDDNNLQVHSLADYNGMAAFSLFDMTGRKVLSLSSEVIDHKVNLDISNISSGVYVLQVSHENKGEQTKIILSK